MLGVFTTKYKLLEKLKSANWLFSLCIIAYAIVFCVEMPTHGLDSLNRHIFMPFCMVVIVVSLFMYRHGQSSRIERMLEALGKRTLDIYMIHYFFVSQISLRAVGNSLETTGNSLLLFIAVFVISVVVTALSVGIGEVLHKGRLIDRFVYGR